MKILKNLFSKKQLPDNFLVWCIGIPYTQEQFRKCCKKQSSDFIDSLKLMYGTNDEELLWDYYSSTAQKIEIAVQQLQKRNVLIINAESVDDLKNAYSYSNVIITAHYHRVLRALDFYGSIIPEKELICSIPKDYKGTIDLSSCNSADFHLKCKLRAPSCTVVAVGTTTSLELRISLYSLIVRYFLNHKNATYLETLRLIAKEIIIKQESHNDNKVLLGGKAKLVMTDLDDKSISPVGACVPIKHLYDNVFSSAFAPAEIKSSSHLLVQVFLHLSDDSNIVSDLAKGADKATERRDVSTFQMHLKYGDKVDVELNVYGENLVHNSKRSIEWQGNLSKSSFCYLVPSDINVNDLYCEINLSVGGVLLGTLSFITQIVANPRYKNSEINTNIYKKIFISYAHQDEDKVKYFAQAYKAQGVEYFYDRYILKGGDVYDEEIERFIDTSDLFILCWSCNSARSVYVEKEVSRALMHAYPQQKYNKATLKIYPISIEPYADLPSNIKDVYNVEVI